LNPRYTFNAFIVGSSNRMAHAASVAVAEKPGTSYNPLFLYGGVGLGKTHLLHAIGHSALESGLAVLYISSETFTNDIVNAIRYRSTEEFRAKYRSVDVLLVDDIQFIAGKESTEEEFFHTFNSLYESSKQIVICSDRPPKSINQLEERLRSRFEWGLIADIQPPDLELRTAILRAKVDYMQREVPNEVIDFVARRVDTNIRELEGSLNRVLVYAELSHSELSVETARLALQNLSIDIRGNQPTLQQIVRAVADYYHIPESLLRGKQRDRYVVLPRQIGMYLMRQETDASTNDIGNELGGRDHTTILHGYEKIAQEIKSNATLKREIEAIRQMLYS
jgi:chromosomal replication initiator protein